MPSELALLPFIESAYNPQALSVAKAAGMWQFVPGTGRTYNLKQNMWQDERRDVLASTSAALDYLSRLHDMFGDWYLALAAYNWGEGNVQRAIARNQAAGLPTDYQSLRMPHETRNYVPKLQAVKNIVMNPQAYGLALPGIPNHPYFVSVTTSRDIDVSTAAKFANMTTEEFRSLNPSFAKPVILGATQPQILLPFDNASAFEHNLKSYVGPLSTWTTYTVTERTRPAALAEKIGIDADTLMSVNKIPVGMRLKPGSTLVVPRTDDADEDISADVAEGAVLAMEPDVPDTRKMLIRVRRKQPMSTIAVRYGVSIAQLKSWNKTRRDVAMPGQVIVLHVPVGKSMPAEPGAQKIATTAPAGARAEKIEVRAADVKPKSRGVKVAKGRVRMTIAKAGDSGAAGKKQQRVQASTKPAAKSSKAAPNSAEIAAATSKVKQQ
jgi:membrane-bound lytic murein transglycosylase D